MKNYPLRVRLITLAVLMFVFGFLPVATRFWWVQVNRHDELNAKAIKRVTEKKILRGVRGNIYDGIVYPRPNVLATTLITFDVYAIPHNMHGRKYEIMRKCLDVTGVDEKRLRKRFENERLKEFSVARGITLEQKLSLADLTGLRFVETQRRYYPRAQLAANLVGYLTYEGKGDNGMERRFDKYLQPTEGEVQNVTTKKGLLLYESAIKLQQDGWDVYLTIQEPLQNIMEEELNRLMREIKPASAYAVMIDPSTGNVLAMAQRPSFNPNDRRKMNPEGFRNRLAEDTFEPGSIMKACSIAWVLEKNKRIGLNTSIYCEKGLWHYGGFPLKDAGHAYEHLRVWGVVQKSSNIGTAKLALSLGNSTPYRQLSVTPDLRNSKAIYEGMQAFGFREKIGLFPIESRGILSDWKTWSKVRNTRVVIGQGISVTALQMARAYGAIANKGVMYNLRLVDRLQNPNEGREAEVKNIPLRRMRRVISEDTAKKITKALKTVTKEGGTAVKGAVPGYEIAGKTGTAQKWIGNSYSDKRHVASFVGFAPADNPRFVLAIIVDDPPYKSRYGGTAAAPYFQKITERSLRFLNVAPDHPEELEPKENER